MEAEDVRVGRKGEGHGAGDVLWALANVGEGGERETPVGERPGVRGKRTGELGLPLGVGTTRSGQGQGMLTPRSGCS